MTTEISPDDVLLVLVTCPPASAEVLANGLVENRLAACVSLVPGIRSVYRWRNAVEQAEEVQLLIKTPRDRLDAVREYLRTQHPYELPEFLVVVVHAASPEYLRWIHSETR